MCLFDECGAPGRRAFLAGAMAAGLIPQALRAAEAESSAGAEVDFPTPVGTTRGYLARPAGRGRHPAVLVLHGVLGLPAWTRSVADELAAAGFVGLSLARFSRNPEVTEDQLRQEGRSSRYLTESFFREQQQEALGAIAYLGRQPFVRRDRLGVVGFCGGGIHAVRLSLVAHGLRGIVSFYGPPALPAQYKHPTDPIRDLVEIGRELRTPLQIHYGTTDYAVPAEAVERLADELRASHTPVEVYAYEGATHAFYEHREEAPNAAAARIAHDRYLRFLRTRLG